MLRPIIALAILVPLLAGCVADVGTRDVAEYSIEEFLETTNYFGGTFSPDKSKVLVSSDHSGIYNAYSFPVDGSDPTALTESDTDSILVRSYFPTDERFVYSSDQGGNELSHIYVRELDGTVRDITPGEGLRARFEGWAADDGSFFVTTNERNPKLFDLYEVATDGYERTVLFQNDDGYSVSGVSPDERYVALTKTQTTADSDIYIFDRQAGTPELITAHEGEVSNRPQEFSPDGKSLYYLTDEGSEFAYLVRYDLASGDTDVVERPDWDVSFARFSKHGKYLVVGINNDARTEIRVFDADRMSPVELPDFPDAEITSVSIARDETTMAFYVSSSKSPRDLYIYEIGAKQPRSLTRSLAPEISADDLVDARVVRFESYDGVEVPGILYRPHGVGPDNPAPALVWVHGGPGGQSRAGYSALVQYLVNHGYVVYAINNRGSSGYGKTFLKMDDRKHGEADLGDCIASKRMLVDTGFVDPERIGIIGASYGGYMVLAAMAFEPEAFDVGVDIFGVANWVRTLNNIPPWWESFREALYTEMGNPETDGERLHRISPVFHADKITRPLMVLQGANDPRVLQAESDDMVAAARDNGAEVEYLIFDDEGHGFRKKTNQQRGYKAILEFLDRHLNPEAAL